MNVAPGASYEAVVDWGVTGLVGALGLTVFDNEGNITVARLSAGIIETPAGSGVYSRPGNVAPAVLGQYTLLWDNGAETPGNVATDSLTVTYSAPGPPVPAPPGSAMCSAWINGADVAACGPDDLGVGTDYSLLDGVAADASWLLFMLTAQKYPGVCTATVRPCRDTCTCWGFPNGNGWQWWWGYDSVGGWWWQNRTNSYRCGCGPESTIRLAGYPVLSIESVTISGEVVDPGTYHLVNYRDLVRKDDPGPPVVHRRWPACQNVTLDDTEPGTFAVTYTWGGLPPDLGLKAAAVVAREIWKACHPDEFGDCELPARVTKVVRQGTTYERVTTVASMWRSGSTGLPLVDAFIAVANPNGAARRPMIWSPDLRRYPQRQPTSGT